MPAVVKLATMRQQIFHLRSELAEIKSRLAEAKSKKAEDERRPGELIAMFTAMLQQQKDATSAIIAGQRTMIEE
jgi:hypothetical protein